MEFESPALRPHYSGRKEWREMPAMAAKPNRPPHCQFGSMADLYNQFESLFLNSEGKLSSACGHDVLLFDHHFFHLAGVRTGEAKNLFMYDEKVIIRATTEGLGKYTLDHGGSRARNLPSARSTILDPDEVWEDNPKTTTARWVYVKEFASKPYPFSIALLVDRPDEGGIIVPVSSFPCTKSDARKWRQGTLIYS